MGKRKQQDFEAEEKKQKKQKKIVEVEEDSHPQVKKKRKPRKQHEIQHDQEFAEVKINTSGLHQEDRVKAKRKATKKRIEEIVNDDPVTEAEKKDPELEEEEEDLTPEEKRVLERKLKKLRKQEEKCRLKEEGKSTVKTAAQALKRTAAQLALDYLVSWSEKRTEWKFQKSRQTWLLQHMYDTEKVPEEGFSTLLSYLEGLQGVARDTTVQKAETLVRELESETAAENPAAQQKAQRAREVIQILS